MKTQKQKRMKDIPVLRDEVKAKRTLSLTPTAWENIKQEAARLQISASELVEEWGRVIPQISTDK